MKDMQEESMKGAKVSKKESVESKPRKNATR